MARPKQPISLIQAKGKKHLTKSEIEERKSTEVKAASDKVTPPSYLPNVLKKEFERISGELIKVEIMTNLDCEALARFVVSEYNYQKVTKKLLKTGVDNDKYFNYLLMQDKLFKQSRQAASDLGLTISSRCKLVVPKQTENEKKNKFSKFAK
ncbi:phage terminase small subunit P27 family [Paraclostridium bifermentans]|uniref:phage terminase small subunit P27 family n=1 Tax=Paraclostridium bifermentans TaxID=1490 RepID=UPI0018A9D805|nr:phage terminase small subunit P27 family [Paraclostridium bifermentans]